MALFVAVLAMNAVPWDLSGVPSACLTLLGGPASVLRWPTLLAGMIFTQPCYWIANQTITQRVLAAPSIREAQKGAYGAAVVRLLIVPPMIALPGVCAYKLYGELSDATYGHIAGQLLPHWLLGVFAAVMFGAVMSSYNSTLDSAAALYVCDRHQKYIDPNGNVARLSVWLQAGFAPLSIALGPLNAGASCIIHLHERPACESPAWRRASNLPLVMASPTPLGSYRKTGPT